MTPTIRATCLLLAAGIVPGSLTVRAQEVSQQDLQVCASKASAAEKLACFESLTVIPEAAPDSARETAGPTVSGGDHAMPGPGTPGVTAGAPAASAAAAAAAVREVPAPVSASSHATAESSDGRQPALPDTGPAAAAPVANESGSTVPRDLGTEHLDRDADADDPLPVTAVVNEVTRSRSGRLYFHLSNGQVWRQNAPRRFHYPTDTEFEVIISRGMMGNYRLRIGETGPMTRIQRVE